jgi:hypothetical protein
MEMVSSTLPTWRFSSANGLVEATGDQPSSEAASWLALKDVSIHVRSDHFARAGLHSPRSHDHAEPSLQVACGPLHWAREERHNGVMTRIQSLSSASRHSVGVVVALILPLADRSFADDFVSVRIARHATASLQAANPAYPSGSPVLLGGVPFDIPSTGNNYIETSSLGGGVVSKEFPIGLGNVAGVHTLINTYWGESGVGTLASLTFEFDDGSTFVKPLDGNVDIRDYYQNFFTNSINGTTTVNVFSTDVDGSAGANPYRLDKQFVDLSAFADRLLVSMTLTDAGANSVQRTFLAGITVQISTPLCVPADLNCDGVVDAADLGLLLGAWGGASGDLNGDGTTDSIDLAILLGAWS